MKLLQNDYKVKINIHKLKTHNSHDTQQLFRVIQYVTILREAKCRVMVESSVRWHSSLSVFNVVKCLSQ